MERPATMVKVVKLAAEVYALQFGQEKESGTCCSAFSSGQISGAALSDPGDNGEPTEGR